MDRKRPRAVLLRDAVTQLGAVNLRDASRRDRRFIHPRENLIQLFAAVRSFENLASFSPAVLRRAGLEHLELLAQLCGEHVVPRGRPLPPLDERGASGFKCPSQQRVPVNE